MLLVGWVTVQAYRRVKFLLGTVLKFHPSENSDPMKQKSTLRQRKLAVVVLLLPIITSSMMFLSAATGEADT